ncbi:MAG: hypothetical protein MI924_32675 [Chloroflexales bacterium]|nr:hypothetical protein [Chloroflexales bacterium]
MYAGEYGFSMNIYSLGCLPGETDDHTRRFALLIRHLRRALGTQGNLFVHYNPTFMKAQTPYEFFSNARPAEIRRKYALLRSALADCNVDFVSVIEDPMVYYQPVLALGDYNAGRVLEHLYRKPHVAESDWLKAFHELGFDDSRYFSPKDPLQTLPWEHIACTDHQRLKRRAGALARSVSENDILLYTEHSQVVPGE